jgi:hypothetical protein
MVEFSEEFIKPHCTLCRFYMVYVHLKLVVPGLGVLLHEALDLQWLHQFVAKHLGQISLIPEGLRGPMSRPVHNVQGSILGQEIPIKFTGRDLLQFGLGHDEELIRVPATLVLALETSAWVIKFLHEFEEWVHIKLIFKLPILKKLLIILVIA